MDSLTQDGRVLRKLRANPKRGVANWQLSQVALSYTKCISNLRKDGYDIKTERMYANGRATGTFMYRLVEEKPSKRDLNV